MRIHGPKKCRVWACIQRKRSGKGLVIISGRRKWPALYFSGWLPHFRLYNELRQQDEMNAERESAWTRRAPSRAGAALPHSATAQEKTTTKKKKNSSSPFFLKTTFFFFFFFFWKCHIRFSQESLGSFSIKDMSCFLSPFPSSPKKQKHQFPFPLNLTSAFFLKRYAFHSKKKFQEKKKTRFLFFFFLGLKSDVFFFFQSFTIHYSFRVRRVPAPRKDSPLPESQPVKSYNYLFYDFFLIRFLPGLFGLACENREILAVVFFFKKKNQK